MGLLSLPELDEKVLSFLKLSGIGADMNKADTRGETPLIKASKMDHVEVVRSLIAAGADTDNVTREHGGFSALHFAAACNHVEVARLLVEDAGADKSLETLIGHPRRYNALDLARAKKNTKIIELLS